MPEQTEQAGQSSSQSGAQSQSGGGTQSGSSQQTSQSQAGTQGTERQQTQAAQRPDWAPESFWDQQKNELKGADFRKAYDDLSAFKAAQDVRLNTLPKAPEEYKPALTKEFKAPEGMPFEFKPDEVAANPLFKQLQQVAHAWDQGKISGQDAISKVLELNVAQAIQNDQELKVRAGEEKQKLGANADARMTAVKQFANAIAGEDLGKELAFGMFTAKQIEGWEKIIKKFTSQGSADFSQQHRDPTGNGAMTDEQWNKMSFTEKQQWQQKSGRRAA